MVEKRFFCNRFIVTRFIITLQKIGKKSFFSSYLMRTDTVIPTDVSPLVVRRTQVFSVVTKLITHFKLTLGPGHGPIRVDSELLFHCVHTSLQYTAIVLMTGAS